MKKVLLLTISLVFALSISTFAQSGKKVYINVSETESGCQKEYTVFDDQTSKVQYKSIYSYDKNNIRLGKILYKWDTKKGWIGVQKYDYESGNTIGASTVLYSEWDSTQNSWIIRGSSPINLDIDFEEMLANELIRQD